MDHIELETLKSDEVFSTLPKEVVEKGLTMPAEAKVTDIKIIVAQIKEDSAKYEAFGIDWNAICQNLNNGANALRSAETLYNVQVDNSDNATSRWANNKGELYSWRNEIMARLGYIATKEGDTDLKDTLELISEGTGHKDCIQDVHATLELTDRYFEKLSLNKLTAERVDEMKAIYEIAAEAYPQTLAGEKEEQEARTLRNRAFWYLCKIEKEFKERELQLALYDDYTRRQEYGSAYLREQRN